MKIYLSGRSKNLYCIVDDEDYEKLVKYRWYLNHKGYAQRNRKYVSKKPDKGQILMHCMVLDPKEGFTTDHINFNKLDNTRQNLRHSTNKDNIRRRGGRKKCTGVYTRKHKTVTRYQSLIRVDGKLINIGYYKTQKEAAIAYNKAAKKYHGEHAYQNTI